MSNTAFHYSGNNNLKSIFNSLSKFTLLGLCTLVAPLAIYLDSRVLGHGVNENSITEWTQEVMLFLSALMFFVIAWRRPAIRGFAILVGGFFGTMLIRELDGIFDVVTHGFWVYPASLWSISAIALAVRYRHGVLAAMAKALQSRPFVYIMLGLIVVLCFSRVFGTTSLWFSILHATDSARLVKGAVQEGLELLGYVLIFGGSISYLNQELRQQVNVTSRFPAAANAPVIDISGILHEIVRRHQVAIPAGVADKVTKARQEWVVYEASFSAVNKQGNLKIQWRKDSA